MKMLVAKAAVLLCAACAASATFAQGRMESPFYCNLSKLTRADRERKADIGRSLAKVRVATREIADGYEFQFPGDEATLKQVYEWVVTERLCCPFFDIDVRAGREDGPVAIRLTGRPGTKDFIRSDFAPWMK